MTLLRRRPRTDAYLDAAAAVLGSPGRRAVTATAVVLAHEIAVEAAPGGADRAGLLVGLAERYGVSQAEVLAEQRALEQLPAVVPAPRRLREPAPRHRPVASRG